LRSQLSRWPPISQAPWTAALDTQIGVQNYTYTFKVVGEKLTGKTKSEFGESEISEGIVKSDDISFVENLNYRRHAVRITYKGKIPGDEIKFMRNVADIFDEPFVAKASETVEGKWGFIPL